MNDCNNIVKNGRSRKKKNTIRRQLIHTQTITIIVVVSIVEVDKPAAVTLIILAVVVIMDISNTKMPLKGFS